MHAPAFLIAGLCAVSFVALLLLIEALTFRRFRPAAKRSRSLGHKKYDASQLPAKIDAIVIGAGQAGLSCAATLAQFGKQVVVLEQHEVTGGGAHQFAVDGKAKWNSRAAQRRPPCRAPSSASPMARTSETVPRSHELLQPKKHSRACTDSRADPRAVSQADLALRLRRGRAQVCDQVARSDARRPHRALPEARVRHRSLPLARGVGAAPLRTVVCVGALLDPRAPRIARLSTDGPLAQVGVGHDGRRARGAHRGRRRRVAQAACYHDGAVARHGLAAVADCQRVPRREAGGGDAHRHKRRRRPTNLLCHSRRPVDALSASTLSALPLQPRTEQRRPTGHGDRDRHAPAGCAAQREEAAASAPRADSHGPHADPPAPKDPPPVYTSWGGLTSRLICDPMTCVLAWGAPPTAHRRRSLAASSSWVSATLSAARSRWRSQW
eukprot:2596443-Prymnesium_polylepis.1